MTARLSIVIEYPFDVPAVAIGKRLFGGTVIAIGKPVTDSQELIATLSPREQQVLEGVAAGHCTSRIATELGISRKTVNSYRYRIHEALGVGNDVLAVKLLLESKITTGATP